MRRVITIIDRPLEQIEGRIEGRDPPLVGFAGHRGGLWRLGQAPLDQGERSLRIRCHGRPNVGVENRKKRGMAGMPAQNVDFPPVRPHYRIFRIFRLYNSLGVRAQGHPDPFGRRVDKAIDGSRVKKATLRSFIRGFDVSALFQRERAAQLLGRDPHPVFHRLR